MERQPIKSVIAYLRNKRSSTVYDDEQSPVKDRNKPNKSNTKYDYLSSVANKKGRLPLMNRFQQSCNQLFSKISTIQSFITSLEKDLKELNLNFNKSFKQSQKSLRQNNPMMIDIKNYSRKIEDMLQDIRHKMSVVYSLQDSKEKVIDQIKDISMKVDKIDLLQRKITKLQEYNQNHFQSTNIDLKQCTIKLQSKNKFNYSKFDRTMKQKHFSSVNY